MNSSPFAGLETTDTCPSWDVADREALRGAEPREQLVDTCATATVCEAVDNKAAEGW